nr:hypothetical protein [Tanacetum cinerariifolium]
MTPSPAVENIILGDVGVGTPLKLGIKIIKTDSDVDEFVNFGYQNKWQVNLYVEHSGYDALDIRDQKETMADDGNESSDAYFSSDEEDLSYVDFHTEVDDNVIIKNVTTNDPFLNKLCPDSAYFLNVLDEPVFANDESVTDSDVDEFVNFGYQNKWQVNLYVEHSGYDALDIRDQKETMADDGNESSDAYFSSDEEDLSYVDFHTEVDDNVIIKNVTTNDPFLNKLCPDSAYFLNVLDEPVFANDESVVEDSENIDPKFNVKNDWRKLLVYYGRDVEAGRCDGSRSKIDEGIGKSPKTPVKAITSGEGCSESPNLANSNKKDDRKKPVCGFRLYEAEELGKQLAKPIVAVTPSAEPTASATHSTDKGKKVAEPQGKNKRSKRKAPASKDEEAAGNQRIIFHKNMGISERIFN